MRFKASNTSLTLALILGAAAMIVASGGCAEGDTIGGDGGGLSSAGAGDSTGGGPDGAGGAGGAHGPGGGAGDTGGTSDGAGGAGCGDHCDGDSDGVLDSADECPDTPAGEPVNDVGCSDSQLEPTLETTFPPYGLTWTPTGDPGRAGGMTWAYTGIDRADMFHIYWIPCDDPAITCGVSLDGLVDVSEAWQFSAADSNLAAGTLVFTNTTHITLADGSSPVLTGRLTMTITGPNDEVVPFADVATLGVTARAGEYGAEITGNGFKILALIEMEDPATVWTPYLDYFDASPTPDPGPGTAVSLGGSFYDE